MNSARWLPAVDQVPDDVLYGWLEGPESHMPEPSIEYLSITCLTLAADHARLRLRGNAAS